MCALLHVPFGRALPLDWMIVSLGTKKSPGSPQVPSSAAYSALGVHLSYLVVSPVEGRCRPVPGFDRFVYAVGGWLGGRSGDGSRFIPVGSCCLVWPIWCCLGRYAVV